MGSHPRQSVSPPTDRVVAVMSLLGGAPDRRFTVTEVGRALEISRATAHAVLNALAVHDWVIRDPESGQFSCGPAVETLVRPSGAGRRLVRARLAELAIELQMQVLLVRRNGTDMTVIDTAGQTATAAQVGLGFHVPFLAPFGREFVAWADDQTHGAWLARLKAARPEFRSRMDEVLADVRDRGYAIERLSPEWLAVHTALQALSGHGDIDIVTTNLAAAIADGTVVDFLTRELHPGQLNEVAMVMAPVRNGDGAVVMSLSVIPFASLETTVLKELGQRMCRTAAELETVIARYEAT
ncbi:MULTISPECIES: helix-turn-helix domain-containing protein [Mycobacterium]|nr:MULTISPECIES: helix-turn-helix domain-containing protein [Mycobacterium]